MKISHKHIALPLMALTMLYTGRAIAQEENKTTTVITTTTKTDSVKSEEKQVKINVSVGKQDYDDRGKEIKYPRIFGGLTFTRIDWGFSRLIDNGSFTLSDENKFLEYGKASNFGFDVAQFGVRTGDATKVYISTGFEWNYLRLKKNVVLDPDATPLAYTESDIAYKKNILTSTYLRVPLTFEWRSRKNHKGDRAKIAVGAMTGVLLKGSQRLKSSEMGKQGFRDNYNLASFQYGAFARVGFGSMALFTKYYFNDMFENSPDQKNLNNLTFGLTLGF
ncbi:PorT family protein [Sphingobacterium psychroaquaticum]|uniref:outer membrane beta-barrel protein n=1 Tax=Sphingobacterium psychroaquaticum TaxID=561061 RepID=UPI00106BE7D3|nr:outer membrane beta-barrel protein [Sphingobacterium psychroaquaticum]QBQ42598.1 PorT family protein [Sphingobacterium psychroaquaticum]